jgi:hypothetical protein
MEWRILKFHWGGTKSDNGLSLQNLSVVFLQGNFFIFGGSLQNTTSSNIIFHFDKDSKKLQELKSISCGKNIPLARERHILIGITPDNAILFGGFNMEKKLRLNDVWLFSPYQLKHWKQMKTVIKVGPTARYGHSMVYSSNCKITHLFTESGVFHVWWI